MQQLLIDGGWSPDERFEQRVRLLASLRAVRLHQQRALRRLRRMERAA